VTNKNFVFDCFGVICSEVVPLLFAKYLPPEMADLVRNTIVRDSDLGAISQSELFERLAEVLPLSARKIEEEYWSYVRLDDGVLAIVKSLRRGHRVALLSNCPAPFFRDLVARYGLDELFETIMVSAEEGIAKPDPALFTRLLERMGVRPADAVMIDDNAANILGAKEAGMEGLHFTSAEELAADLKALYAISV